MTRLLIYGAVAGYVYGAACLWLGISWYIIMPSAFLLGCWIGLRNTNEERDDAH